MKLRLLAMLLLLTFQHAFAESKFISTYNSKQNTISIKAKDIKLLELLTRVGLQTGIEIYADNTIDKTVNYEVIDAPLERAIKQLTKGLSTAVSYTEDSDPHSKVLTISSIRILPSGEANPKNVIALSSLDAAAVAYAQFSKAEAPTTEQAKEVITADNYDHMQTRWLTRISKLPLETRMHIENIIQQQQELHEQSLAENAAQITKAKEEQKEQQRQRELKEARLQELDPERYKLRQQRMQEIQEQREREAQNKKLEVPF